MIKSILGGKSKNLCDVAYLLTLPLDKNFNRYGFWEVEISVEPNTVYTFSRENANQINVGGATYVGITNRYDIPNGGNSQWLNHETLPGLCHQNVQITAGAEGKLWIFFSANTYKKWQNHGNPFGYLQLEKGSTATEYVPHELTSYKSIMKVSDGRFVTSFDERMPCKTKNLFDINANSEKGFYDEQGNFYPTDIYLCFTIDVISNNIYCISTSRLGSVKGIVSFWNNNTFVSAVNYGEQTAFAYTVPSGANKLKFVIEANQKYSNIQLELGTTATDYVPYGYV